MFTCARLVHAAFTGNINILVVSNCVFIEYLRRLGGTLIPAFFSALSHAFPPDGPPLLVARHLTGLDIFAIASALTVWMAALAVAIGCLMVVVMKGPAYVADAYPLPDSEHPEDARNPRRM